MRFLSSEWGKINAKAKQIPEGLQLLKSHWKFLKIWAGISRAGWEFPNSQLETLRNPNPRSGEFLPSGNAERFWEIKLRSGREGAQVPPKNPKNPKNVELSLVQLWQSQSCPQILPDPWNSVCASPAWEFQEGGRERRGEEGSS